MARTDSSIDLPRQVVVTASWMFMLISAWRVSAVPALTAPLEMLSKSIPPLHPVVWEELLKGWLRPEITLLTPSPMVWWAWLVILIGMLGFVIWQWSASGTEDPRCSDSGWWMAFAMALVAQFLWVVEDENAWLAFGMLVVATVFSWLGVRQISGMSPARTLTSSLFSVLGPEIMLGSLTVSNAWFLACVLGISGTPLTDFGGQITCLIIMIGFVVSAALLIGSLGPRLLLALSMAWWIGCIAWARLNEHPRADMLGWGAAGAAIMVLFLNLGSLISAAKN